MSRRFARGRHLAAGGRLGRPGGATRLVETGEMKEGAQGGTMGSPLLNARDVRFLDV